MTAPRRALIVVDVQQEYFEGPLQIQHPPREETLARAVQALDAAAEHDLPVVVVQHELPEDAPVFAVGSEGQRNHPGIEERPSDSWKRVAKSKASVFADTDVATWLAERDVDTVTLVGFMTNNCVIGSAADAERLGLAVEVLSDATGAIHLANEAGSASAQQVHETLMTVLHSNWAAVATTQAWVTAAGAGEALTGSDLGTSAVQGRAQFGG